jgi:pyrroloquinoline quinone biosynthesis protein E
MTTPQPARPLGLLAELTHRCPLGCPYCSNPMELEDRSRELDAGAWAEVFRQAAEMGVLQVHLSGGEPASRRDLVEIVEAASREGLYTNLITSAVGLDRERLVRLRSAGLEHVQVSIQDVDPERSDAIADYRGAYARKVALAGDVVLLGMPLTLNVVVHRANIERLADMVRLAASLGARRIEIAHVQYYGWALHNRAALMPTRMQAEAAVGQIETLREAYAGQLTIDSVVPDYYARRPKPCMGGWGSRSLNVTPSGIVLPCHAAQTVPGLEFWSVRDHALAEIWERSPAFSAFRGVDWMKEPCRSCSFREMDFGGCRCQALAITGDAAATDPSCEFSPHHGYLRVLAEEAATSEEAPIGYRGRVLHVGCHTGSRGG